MYAHNNNIITERSIHQVYGCGFSELFYHTTVCMYVCMVVDDWRGDWRSHQGQSLLRIRSLPDLEDAFTLENMAIVEPGTAVRTGSPPCGNIETIIAVVVAVIYIL